MTIWLVFICSYREAIDFQGGFSRKSSLITAGPGFHDGPLSLMIDRKLKNGDFHSYIIVILYIYIYYLYIYIYYTYIHRYLELVFM